MYKTCAAFLLALAVTTFSGSLSAAASFKDDATGAIFPGTVTISEGGSNYSLDYTGMATRHKFFIKIYTIAHYLQNPSNGTMHAVLNEVFDASRAKQFTIVWVRSVEAAKIQGAFQESLKANLTGADYAALAPSINTFLGYFNEASKKGDTYVIQWTPDGNLTVFINNTNVGQIANSELAEAVWNIWFGSDEVVKRKELLKEFLN